ncbi:MAG TPA: bifunctional histidinol-phosphatase/imidazoleglycerol-phosphate dehydratase HisB [Oligoflexus sp.]|uniref:bifunctional histidinol-phosphatase/imidazoleglycerol-phosphate dehydratase HisB n=1 Tax=Oligoflexus sp. TaxID=1971216 RepID=UPI002D448AF4|nr:bifunctional histidinol-phosphatase/imidazoleglycerol-phosphate dehydratase HisB [Oligoflexus sp.]HYX34001.1 bifunctional histidinol-phosphatase/imidazoleglycerol-phosphate dehydratase HisB [Oligoflexus sp.]
MQKILFIDRDGTINLEPQDYQVDRLDKIRFVPGVIPALLRFKEAGYALVMITNQDGLGTDSFPQADFEICQNFIVDLLQSQGITFEAILICPHFREAGCACRKPGVGMVLPWLQRTDWNRPASAVIGDRDTDMELAANMGIRGMRIASPFGEGLSWAQIADELLLADRKAEVRRETKETQIRVAVNLDQSQPVSMKTGVGFFDHMLDQIARHAGISVQIECQGDLVIDDHHSIEDVGLALGQALKQALGDKRGIQRYGFALPMDEADAQVLLDLGGRPYSIFEADFQREKIGELSTEMIPHFFRSLAETLGANLHIRARGQNDHHIAEGIFKAFARSLREAVKKSGTDLPTTKGLL